MRHALLLFIQATTDDVPRQSFPFEDPIVVLEVTGQAILDALENSVSLYPALEGRFPQVSNLSFTFDPRLPSGKRISSPRLGDSALDLSKKYSIATRDYMARGKDGFASLASDEVGGSAKLLVNDESGVLMSALLRQYFLSLRALGAWAAAGANDGVDDALHKHFREQVHEQLHAAHAPDGIQTVRMRVHAGLEDESRDKDGAHPDDDSPSDDEDDEHLDKHAQGKTETSVVGQKHTTADHHTTVTQRARLARKYVRRWALKAGMDKKLCCVEQHDNAGSVKAPSDGDSPAQGLGWTKWTRAICPRVEGRITCLSPV